MTQARQLHRKAESIDWARQAQMKAAQAASDPALLATGIYDAMDPKPLPAK